MNETEAIKLPGQQKSGNEQASLDIDQSFSTVQSKPSIPLQPTELCPGLALI